METDSSTFKNLIKIKDICKSSHIYIIKSTNIFKSVRDIFKSIHRNH